MSWSAWLFGTGVLEGTGVAVGGTGVGSGVEKLQAVSRKTKNRTVADFLNWMIMSASN
jgi:hypothetical protein